MTLSYAKTPYCISWHTVSTARRLKINVVERGAAKATLEVLKVLSSGATPLTCQVRGAQEYPEDCRYNTLLQISIGQEETDDIIARDIYRTFPEHPQFGFEQGQQALFRVLKAYSLHDLEVPRSILSYWVPGFWTPPPSFHALP